MSRKQQEAMQKMMDTHRRRPLVPAHLHKPTMIYNLVQAAQDKRALHSDS